MIQTRYINNFQENESKRKSKCAKYVNLLPCFDRGSTFTVTSRVINRRRFKFKNEQKEFGLNLGAHNGEISFVSLTNHLLSLMAMSRTASMKAMTEHDNMTVPGEAEQ